MEKKRIYPATQLIVALDPKVLKVYLWILSWSGSSGDVKYYEKQFSKATKLEVREVEECIQSLVDAKLVDVSYTDGTFILTPNVEQNQKYYQVPIAKVLEGKGISKANHVDWNALQSEKVEPQITDPSEMSEDEIKRMILRLQASLNEKKQIKQTVKSATPAIVDDLPF